MYILSLRFCFPCQCLLRGFRSLEYNIWWVLSTTCKEYDIEGIVINSFYSKLITLSLLKVIVRLHLQMSYIRLNTVNVFSENPTAILIASWLNPISSLCAYNLYFFFFFYNYWLTNAIFETFMSTYFICSKYWIYTWTFLKFQMLVAKCRLSKVNSWFLFYVNKLF